MVLLISACQRESPIKISPPFIRFLDNIGFDGMLIQEALAPVKARIRSVVRARAERITIMATTGNTYVNSAFERSAPQMDSCARNTVFLWVRTTQT